MNESDTQLADAWKMPAEVSEVLAEEVLQLCSHPMVGWQDVPPGIFGLWSIRSGANLNRRSSSWQWDGTCVFHCRTATWRSCSPSGVCTPITSPSGGEFSATPRKSVGACAQGSSRRMTVGGWMRPTSGSRASGCIYTGPWIRAVRRSTSSSWPNAMQQRLSAFWPKPWAV